MTKLKNRMAGITAAAMTAAALTAAIAAPAMAETDCLRDADATITVNPTSRYAEVTVTTDAGSTLIKYLSPTRGTFRALGVAVDQVDGCGTHLGTSRLMPVGSHISQQGSDLVITVGGSAESPVVTVSTVVVDTDGDGVADADDRFPNSILGDTVVVGDVATTVPNVVSADGASLSDLFAEALASDDRKADKKAAKDLIKALDKADALSKDDKESLKSAVKDVLKAQKAAEKA